MHAPSSNSESRLLEVDLREMVLAEIERQKLSDRDLAEKLDMLPSGANLLLERTAWPLDLGIRVASHLGMKVELTATPKA